MTTFTDTQLKQALTKMLPEELDTEPLEVADIPDTPLLLVWKKKQKHFPEHWTQVVLDTELLHICWLVEQTVDAVEYMELLLAQLNIDYLHRSPDEWSFDEFLLIANASWQNRTIALAKVKGIEIV